MAKFENAHGDVIEVESEAAANDYRHRAGFTEIGAKRVAKKTAKKSDEA